MKNSGLQRLVFCLICLSKSAGFSACIFWSAFWEGGQLAVNVSSNLQCHYIELVTALAVLLHINMLY